MDCFYSGENAGFCLELVSAFTRTWGFICISELDMCYDPACVLCRIVSITKQSLFV